MRYGLHFLPQELLDGSAMIGNLIPHRLDSPQNRRVLSDFYKNSIGQEGILHGAS